MLSRVLPRAFYKRDPAIVATKLLGNVLIRKLKDKVLEGIIVEVEAYYGSSDPASRAYNGMKTYNEQMWNEPGNTFIYNVHKYWMFNVVAHKASKVGAVLIRAMEPTRGIEVMKAHRPVEEVAELTNGPGKLTTALKIDKRLNGIPVTSSRSEVFIVNHEFKFEIGISHRIGVKKDLERKLRFFINGNRFVSK